ncbi:MAG: transglutaminase family protein [Ectothiorhodospiraceae bacterium]
MRYRVSHRTDYTYAQSLARGYNEARISPRDTPGQRVIRHDVAIHPQPAYRSTRTDYFGNTVLHFSIQHPHSRLTITAVSEVELQAADADGAASMAWEQAVSAVRDDTSASGLEAREYRLASPLVPPLDALVEYAAPSFATGRSVAAAVEDLMARIHVDFTYDPAATTVTTPLDRVFRERRGVCQDFAHLAVGCLRAMGLPARYVSGYLETLPPPGQEKLRGADASHAWFAVYDPLLGWLDFDPTNNVIPMDKHITTAWGRDYGDISPIKGIIFGGGGGQSNEVAVDVERLD